MGSDMSSDAIDQGSFSSHSNKIVNDKEQMNVQKSSHSPQVTRKQLIVFDSIYNKYNILVRHLITQRYGGEREEGKE